MGKKKTTKRAATKAPRKKAAEAAAEEVTFDQIALAGKLANRQPRNTNYAKLVTIVDDEEQTVLVDLRTCSEEVTNHVRELFGQHA
jgi:hypothetical protein